MWWADDSFIDFSVANNREEFWDTTADRLRDPGSNGSNPSGAQPLVCHVEASDGHTTNRGSGGNADAGSNSGNGISPGAFADDFSAGYTSNAWTFDGTSDHIEANGADSSDRNICIVSFWFRVNTLNRAQYLWSGFNIARPYVRLSASNQLQVKIAGNGAADRWTGDVVGGVISDNSWHHFCMSWNSNIFTTTNDLTIRLDGVARSLSSGPASAGSTEMNLYNYVGALGTGSATVDAGSKFDGDISEFFLHAGLASYFDLDGAGNIEKFRTAGGKPVDLGADGSTPLGVQPNNYLKNPAALANVNSGSQGDWNTVGTLDVAASSPSD